MTTKEQDKEKSNNLIALDTNENDQKNNKSEITSKTNYNLFLLFLIFLSIICVISTIFLAFRNESQKKLIIENNKTIESLKEKESIGQKQLENTKKKLNVAIYNLTKVTDEKDKLVVENIKLIKELNTTKTNLQQTQNVKGAQVVEVKNETYGKVNPFEGIDEKKSFVYLKEIDGEVYKLVITKDKNNNAAGDSMRIIIDQANCASQTYYTTSILVYRLQKMSKFFRVCNNENEIIERFRFIDEEMKKGKGDMCTLSLSKNREGKISFTITTKITRIEQSVILLLEEKTKNPKELFKYLSGLIKKQENTIKELTKSN